MSRKCVNKTRSRAQYIEGKDPQHHHGATAEEELRNSYLKGRAHLQGKWTETRKGFCVSEF